jgi:hypothetical protein
MAETIREFLVNLGYSIDDRGEKKFKDSIRSATLQAELLSKALVSAAKTIAVAMESIAQNFDNLYWTSQRTQASVQNIRALSYAVSQLGGTYQGAMSSIEAFGQKLRTNPGYESMVKGLGVQTRDARGQLRDQVQVMEDLGTRLKRMPYYVANQYAGALGIDENTMRALQSGDLQKLMREQADREKAVGLDSDKAAKASQEFMRGMRGVQATIEALASKALTDYMPQITAWLEKFQKWVVDNGPQIQRIFEDVASAVATVAGDFAELIKKLEPAAEAFTKVAESITGRDGLAAAIELLVGAAVLGKLVTMLTTLVGTGGATGGLLGRFLGIAGIGAAAIAGAETITNPSQGLQNAPRLGKWGLDDVLRWGAGKVSSWWSGAGDNSSGAGKPISGSQRDQNALQMYRALRQSGLSRAAAIGIVANADAESSMNPGSVGDGGAARGYFQHHGDRRKAIFDATGINMGDPKLSPSDAVKGLLWEMQSSGDGGARKAWRMLQNVTDPREAAAIMSLYYERPAAQSLEARKRAGIASGWAKRLNDGVSDTAGSGSRSGAFNFAHPAFNQATSPLTNPTNMGVSMSQNTNISVVGSSSPMDTANAVAARQDGVNSRLLRNTQGAVR